MAKFEKLNIVIPMAGAGSRFSKAGYKDPKPFIQVRDRPMIQMVAGNVRVRNCRFIFVAQESHAKQYDLEKRLRAIVPDCEIILINGLTDGACCTVLKARQLIDNEDALLMANSDQFLEWDAQEFVDQLQDSDGVISTFHMPEPDKKWSYAKLNEQGFVTDVQEKNPISDLATTGIYLWLKGKDFVRCAEKMIAKDLRCNDEFYVAPVYNEGIAEGLKFKVHNCKKMWGTGIPDDLNYFLCNCKEPFEPLN